MLLRFVGSLPKECIRIQYGCLSMCMCQGLLVDASCAVQSMYVIKYKHVLTHFLEIRLKVIQSYVEEGRDDNGLQ